MESMNDEQIERLRYILNRQDEAYKTDPIGKWWQRWIPLTCAHLEKRCIHGDEILARRGRRVVCRVCGRTLDEPLPMICFFTGEPHGDRYTISPLCFNPECPKLGYCGGECSRNF